MRKNRIWMFAAASAEHVDAVSLGRILARADGAPELGRDLSHVADAHRRIDGVVSWSLLLFCGYGLVSPVNGTVIATLAPSRSPAPSS
jgi:hypothetical protein